jgi:diacylglycerol kinase
MSADRPPRSDHELSGNEPPRPSSEHHASALKRQPSPRRWREKFRDAFRGLRLGVWGQSSFAVHFGMALLVLIAGAVLQVSRLEWAILVVCIFMVLAAEMFNSSLEWFSGLAKRPHPLHSHGYGNSPHMT